jgi:hypothetical protein
MSRSALHGCGMYHNIHVIPPKEIIEAYGQLVKDKLSSGDWEGYMLSVMFNPLPGSPAVTIKCMHQATTALFSKLVTRTVRRPNTRKGKTKTPIGIFFMDIPDGLRVLDTRDVLVNDGVHMHGIIMVPTTSRLKEPLDVHFAKNKSLYQVGTSIHHIDVRSINYASDQATSYSGKAVSKRRFGYDDILILA